MDLSGAQNTTLLIQHIEERIRLNNINQVKKEQIQYILKATKEFVQYGEWVVGFEIMVSNLDEINFKVDEDELTLMKKIFEQAKVDWRKDWSWIEQLKKEN